jgi:hypothetical protein
MSDKACRLKREYKILNEANKKTSKNSNKSLVAVCKPPGGAIGSEQRFDKITPLRRFCSRI